MILPQRILEKIEPEPNSGCWLWCASLNGSGYGLVHYGAGPKLAHRVVYLLIVGEIPIDKELDHTCRVRSCVNPEHLRAVSHRENIVAPGSMVGRRLALSCKRGHGFDGENTYQHGVKKHCRACRRIADRKRRLRESVV